MNILKQWQQRSETLAAARQAERQWPAWAVVLVFIGLFLLSQVVVGISTLPFLLPGILRGEFTFLDTAAVDAFINTSGLALYLTIPTTVIFLLFMRYVERRTLFSAGFTRRRIAARYLGGLGIGMAMILLTAWIVCLMGGMRFEGFNSQIAWDTLIIFFIGFLFQGMGEEVLLRGFMMVSMANRSPLWLAIAVNSLVFAILHLFNPGVTVISVLNLILYGIFASFFFLRTDNIWGIGALHAAWNFTQGNVLGIKVSGIAIPDPIMHLSPIAEAPSSLSGGVFGVEGTLVLTILLCIGIATLICWPKKPQTQQ